MKKLACICLAALMLLAAMTGCSAADDGKTGGAPAGKVVVNFEGTVTAVDGAEVTLNSGKIVVLTGDTVYAGDPDTGAAVSDEIAVGNFIQGYTADDPDAERVTASKLYCNEMPRTGGKLVIDFEGTVASVEKDRIVLEDGQVVLITGDTVFSVPGGIVKSVVITEGHRIQGSTEQDPTATEVTASRIHIIAE